MNPVRVQSSCQESHIVPCGKVFPAFVVLAGALSSAEAAVEGLELRVQGIQCTLCARTVERIVSKLPGVGEASLEAGEGLLRVSALPGRSLDPDAIRKRLVKSGFPPAVDEEIRAVGSLQRGPRDRLIFRITGGREQFDLLEGAQLKRLLQELPAGVPSRVAVRARVHRHPATLPPSLSILSYEVEAKR